LCDFWGEEEEVFFVGFLELAFSAAFWEFGVINRLLALFVFRLEKTRGKFFEVTIILKLREFFVVMTGKGAGRHEIYV
jgi:hypothetical protein